MNYKKYALIGAIAGTLAVVSLQLVQLSIAVITIFLAIFTLGTGARNNGKVPKLVMLLAYTVFLSPMIISIAASNFLSPIGIVIFIHVILWGICLVVTLIAWGEVKVASELDGGSLWDEADYAGKDENENTFKKFVASSPTKMFAVGFFAPLLFMAIKMHLYVANHVEWQLQ